MKRLIAKLTRGFESSGQLSQAAENERRLDASGVADRDPGPDSAIRAHVRWLKRAQDFSTSNDGGVSRSFSLLTGWTSSYPETTGYIVPTLLDLSRRLGDQDLRSRVHRMLGWLASIQFPEGGIQGGKIDAQPCVPVTFNTGQVLIGLAAGVKAFGEEFRTPMLLAATWLRDTLDADGCWRKHPTPFAKPGEKAYETHVSWGLFEAERMQPGEGFGAAGLRQVKWALTKQQKNGWIADCCLTDPAMPLTHTLGYAARGILEAYALSGEPGLLAAARRTADPLLSALRPDGHLPGRFRSTWQPAVKFACLTGTVQIAACWLILFRATSDPRYLEGARRANAYVRRTVRMSGPPDIIGGVKGSFPVDGSYGAYEYLNWAAKFSIDSNLLETDLESVCP